MPRFDQKGIAHIALIILVLLGIVLGIYLVQNPQIFSPKASETTPVTVPVYRLHNAARGYSLWTADQQEVQTLVAQGFTNAGVAFYAYSANPPAGTVPLTILSRYSDPPQFFLITDQTQIATMLRPTQYHGELDDRLERAFRAGYNNNWSIRNQSLYVYPNTYTPTTGLTPVYQLVIESESAHYRGPLHYFTSDGWEIPSLQNSGFTLEWVAFYAPSPTASGTISASPNPCTLTEAGTCSTKLSWNYIGRNDVQIRLRDGGNLVAAAPVGQTDINWIIAGGAIFDVYSGGSVIDSLTVAAISPSPSPAPSASPVSNIFSASPNPCNLQGNEVCTSTISWSSSYPDLYITIKENPGSLFAKGASGSQAAPWIRASGATFEAYSGNTKVGSIFVSGQ